MNMDSLSFSLLCRFCLNTVDSAHRNKLNSSIKKQFKDLTNLELSKDSFFSDFSCQDCLDILSTCLVRKTTFINNQNYLLEKFQEQKREVPKKPDPVDIKKDEEDQVEVCLENIKIDIKEEEMEIETFENFVYIKEEPISDNEIGEDSNNVESSSKILSDTEEIGSTLAVHLTPCKICGKMLRKGSHRMHMRRIHTKAKRFFCDICNKGFFFQHLIMNHLKTHFNIKDFHCDMCDLTFTSKSGMFNHKKTIHLGIKNEFNRTCEYCGACFNCKTYYDNHVRSKHTGEKPFKCEYENCQKTYCTSGELYKHKKSIHCLPVECPICLKQVRNLKRHNDCVHIGKKYKCKFEENGIICDKEYASKTGLSLHFNSSHRGFKKYVCNLCDASYFKPDNLSDHIRIVHKKLKIKCELCSTLITRKDYYRRHIILHHKELDEATRNKMLEKIKKEKLEYCEVAQK